MAHQLDAEHAPSAILSPAFGKLFVGLLLCILNLNLFALVPYYLELRGTSELFYGTAAGMQGLGGVAAMVLFGSLADRVSRRRAVLGYLAIACAGNAIAFAAVDDAPGWYLLAIALHGVVGGGGLPVLFVWASELSPPARRTEAFAWLGIAGLSGDTLGPLLGESLLLSQPDPHSPEAFRVVFLVANVFPFLAALFFLWAPDVRAPLAAGARGGLGPLLQRREIRLLLAATVAFGGALGVLTSLGKNFVVSVGLELVSVLLAGHTVGAVLARLALPWVLARVDRTRLVPVCFAGVALSLALLTFARGYGLLAVAGLVYGVSHGFLFPSLLARVIDFGGRDAAGRVSTLYMGMFSLGMGLFPAAGGLVLEAAGYPTLFAVVALACLGAIALHRGAERAHAGLRAGSGP